MDLALRMGHNEIIQMLVQKGGKCLKVCEEKGERRKLMRGQHQAKLDLFLASNPMAMCEPAATNLQKALGVSARIASVLAAALPESEEINEWFEDGRLPCSFSLQPLWKPILAQLEDFDQALTNKSPTLKAFVRSTAQMERKLVSRMEDQLEEDKEGLFSLNERGGPKLGLLLNCFGEIGRAHV